MASIVCPLIPLNNTGAYVLLFGSMSLSRFRLPSVKGSIEEIRPQHSNRKSNVF
jgi:hypothetical protein